MRILLVHSSGPQGPGEGSDPFAARLRDQLGSDHEVSFPMMPHPEEPHYEPWSERLGQILEEADDPLVVVGHSLGGSVVLKHLADGGDSEPIARLLLLETPFWGREEEWELEWALPEGWTAAETALPPTFLFHGRDDEEIPFSHLELYAKVLPDAEVHPLEGTGHLLDRGDLSEILDAIRGQADG
ncbi:MAG TPA: alpha/beta hydrolase [Solirubrobacterales bacterium]